VGVREKEGGKLKKRKTQEKALGKRRRKKRQKEGKE